MRLKTTGGIALGLLTAVGGFVDIGGVVTAMQSGSQFRYSLLWTLIPGITGAILFTEMSGRVAVASGRPMFDFIRERLGYKLALIPLLSAITANFLTLVAEMAGMALVLQLASRISYLLWFPLAAFFLWLILWKASFNLLDVGTAFLGLATLVFVAAMVVVQPPWGQVAREFVLPSIPNVRIASYLFMVVSLLGAYMTPYQFYFYSSGAMEEEWKGEDLILNRTSSTIGTAFGGVLDLAIVLVAAVTLFPNDNPRLGDLGGTISGAFDGAGWVLFLVGVFAVSLGAGLECSLSTAYGVAQYLGFDWGKHFRPRDAPVFSLVYTIMVPLAVLIAITGISPISLTLWAMAIAAFSLPFTIAPLLVVANDPLYMGEQANSWPVNVLAVFLLVLLCIVTIAVIPLLILAGVS